MFDAGLPDLEPFVVRPVVVVDPVRPDLAEVPPLAPAVADPVEPLTRDALPPVAVAAVGDGVKLDVLAARTDPRRPDDDVGCFGVEGTGKIRKIKIISPSK